MTANLAQIETTSIRNTFGLLIFRLTLCHCSVVVERYTSRSGNAIPVRRILERTYGDSDAAAEAADRLVRKLRRMA